MGKRSAFPDRPPRDFWPTPPEVVAPLLPHLPPGCRFVEPCAGNGALVRALEAAGHVCVMLSDLSPSAPGIDDMDVFDRRFPAAVAAAHADLIITNPPWTRAVMHPMIRAFVALRPAWLLFDADWLHTGQSAAFLPFLRDVVSVGRVRWIAGSRSTGKDNCAWHRFATPARSAPAAFWGRGA